MTRSQRRSARVSNVENDGRNIRVVAVRYNTVDDYGTVFLPGVFDESISQRLPVFAWAHDWSEPIGRAVSYESTAEALLIDFRLSDPEAVPRARQAAAQFADGTLTDVSVGFYDAKGHEPDDAELRQFPGARYMFDSAGLDEVSAVLRGAVPGAELVSQRTGQTVELDAVVALARKVAAGVITEAEAREALALLTPPAEEPPTDPPTEQDPPAAEESDEVPVEDIDAALALALGRSAYR